MTAIECALDLRYAGQGYEVTLACPCPLGDGGLASIAARASTRSTARRSGTPRPTEPVEIVSYRVRGIGRVPPVELPRYEPQGIAAETAIRARRRAIFDGVALDCPVYQRDKLDVGATIAGPAIIDQLDCTTVLPPGHVARVDDYQEPDHQAWSGMTWALCRPERLDAVELEIIKASLDGIVQEMQNSLFRTGYSTIVRESQDASCAIMDARGEVVAQHVVLPLHIASFPACCAAVLRDYDDIAEGDAFLINHPYEGGSPHAPDMCVITPVFADAASGLAPERPAKRQLVGFCGSIAHKSDIGGPVPGSCSGQAKEIFNEGLHLPAVRYQRGFQRNIEIERIIAANSRTPELVLGDIRGQLGSSRLGEQRVLDLAGKFGTCDAGCEFRAAEGVDRRRGCGWRSRNGRTAATRPSGSSTTTACGWTSP